MIVVGRFLHQVDRSPHNAVHKDAEPVLISHHHQQPKQTHDRVITYHAVARKRLQKVKAYKIEGKLRLDESPPYPACEDRSNSLNEQQCTKNDPEHYKCRIVNPGEEPFIQHNCHECTEG